MSYRVVSNLANVLDKIDSDLADANELAARVVENRAKALCPVDTGRLRASIDHHSDASGFDVGSNVEYAIYQELGTRYQTGQAFLRPALQSTMAEIQAIFESG